MEEWQTDWIVANMPRLHSLTQVSQLVLDELCSKSILGLDDVDELIRIGKHEEDGVAVQKSKLYLKLMKNNCYDDVIEVLLKCKLSGAANLLREGKALHVKTGKSGAVLFGNCIPAPLSYYIPRSIRSRFVLSKQVIFGKETTKDIFLFTGIKQNELSSFLRHLSISSDKSGSQVSQMSLSVRHILLETKAHFQKICKLAKGRPVHWLHYEKGKFLSVKSGNGDMSTIQKATEGMAEENEVFSENELLAHLQMMERKFGNCPVVISDTPGMGKSALLQSLARQIVRKSKAGKDKSDKSVIFLVISELVHLLKEGMRTRGGLLCKDLLESALTQLTTESGEDGGITLKILLQQSPSSNQVKSELMLDGYDEINLEDIPLARDVFSLLQENYPSTRLWVATRPHLLRQLENELNVTGFTILPFDESNQEKFLVSFWHSKSCEHSSCEYHRQANSECSDDLDISLVTKVAKHCLKSLATNCLKDPRAGDICGVPLQCRMLAEVFHEDCFNFVSRTNWTSEEEPTLSLKITSITDLYQALINVKLDKYSRRYSSEGLCQRKRAQLLNQHVFLGIQLLFPSCALSITDKLKKGTSSPNDDILDVGLVESTGGAGCNLSPPRFIHRTIAEFMVARGVAAVLYREEEEETNWWRGVWSRIFQKARDIWGIVSREQGSLFDDQYLLLLLSFLLKKEILRTERCDVEFRKYTNFAVDFDKFEHHVIVFFLNSLLQGKDLQGHNWREGDGGSVGNAVAASVFHDHFNLFRAFLKDGEAPSTRHPIYNILLVGVRQVSLNLLKVLFETFRDSWEVEGDKTLRTLVEEKAELLRCAVQYRDYSVVDYLINCEGLRELIEHFDASIRDLLHALVCCSQNDPEWLVRDKINVLEGLAKLQPQLLDWRVVSNTTPFLQTHVHVELALSLIGLDANPLARGPDNSTLLYFSRYLTGKDYHSVVVSLSEKEHVLRQLVNVKTEGLQQTVIHHIAQFLRTPKKATLDCLLQHGAIFTCTDRKGRNCLHLAAENGNVGSARILLEFDVVVRECLNARDVEGKTPLDNLVTCSRTRLLDKGLLMLEEFGKLLLEKGAKLSCNSILHNVLSKGLTELNLDSVQFLIEVYLVDVNVLDEESNTPLHTCMKNLRRGWATHVEITRMLLAKGADVKACNAANQTPLDVLIKESSSIDESCLEALVILEEYGAVKNSPEMATQALLFAIKGNSWSLYDKFEKIAEKLVEEGAQVENILSLETCALRGWTLGIRYLLEKRIDLNLRGSGGGRGETILHLYMSAIEPLAEVVELLLAKGSKVGDLDENGKTPLERGLRGSILPFEVIKLFVNHGVARLNRPVLANQILFKLVEFGEAEELQELAEKIVSDGGDLNAIDNEGSSLLHEAAHYRCVPMIRYLVATGLSVNLRNSRGMTPLHCALKRIDGPDPMPCVLVLQELGACLEAVDDEKETSLHFAAKYQRVHVLKFFLKTTLFDHLLTNGEFLLDVVSSGDVFLENLKEIFAKFGRKGLQDVGRDSKNPERRSIVHVATKRGEADLVQYLLEAKLFVLSPLCGEELIRFGNILHICVRNSEAESKFSRMDEDKSEIIQLLVQANKEFLRRKDAFGRMCLHVENVSLELLQALIENGADVNAKDGNGNTVVDLAEKYMIEEDFTSFIDYLRAKGHTDLATRASGTGSKN